MPILPMIIYCATIYDNLLQMSYSKIERDKILFMKYYRFLGAGRLEKYGYPQCNSRVIKKLVFSGGITLKFPIFENYTAHNLFKKSRRQRLRPY